MLLYVFLGTSRLHPESIGAADYNYIQGMFLFEQFQLYGIIGTAVALTAPGLWMLKRYGRTVTGRPLEIELKPPIAVTLLAGSSSASAGRWPACVPARSS